MALTVGSRLGVYDIVGLIGSGGMGEVYRARDSRLKRDVAIKILPESFAGDPDRLARFQREAEVLASLNHTNIAAIYGLEERALVLELVEGETLAERIARGPIPVDEALPLARQIAGALEAAHDRGIVHRDLKPLNIKLTAGGTVKVLDFGLAKMLAGDAAPASLSMSPTLSIQATYAGIILGTVGYMSPEQARGKEVDQRTDIWAFGCVLYEMLTRRQAFETGDSVSDAVAAILTREPDWSALPTQVPANIRRVLRRCLQKDPARRLHHIADARVELDDDAGEPAAAVTPRAAAASPWKRVLPWAVTALALSAAGLLLLRESSSEPALSPVRRLEINLPPGLELYTTQSRTVAVSPDGSSLAFIGVASGARLVYIRRFDEFESTPLKGTDGAVVVFFSPDGASVGLETSGGQLKAVSLADGLVTPLATGANYVYGATWTADGRIVFVRGDTLSSVVPSGGPPAQLTTLDSARGETRHAWPVALAGGRAVAFAAVSGSRSHIDVLLPTGERRTIVDNGTMPLMGGGGHLVFFRDGELLAAPFDGAALEVIGPVIRAADTLPASVAGVPIADVSPSGTLVFAPTVATSRLVWVSRDGAEQILNDTLRSYANPRIGPNGSTVLVEAGDLWIQDVARATFSRLTASDEGLTKFPVWSSDGRVLYRSPSGLRLQEVGGGGAGRLLSDTSELDYPGAVASDGDTIVFIRGSVDTSMDIYALSMRDPDKVWPLVNTPAYEGGARLSPDERWLVYVSNESGRNEVYVRPFPGQGRRWQVSTDGGTQAIWNRNGREIFYRVGDRMMAVGFATMPDVSLSAPQVLFERPYTYGTGITIANYDVTPDGRQFVMVKDQATAGRLSVVLNWLSELGR